jgi:hypothetical protein
MELQYLLLAEGDKMSIAKALEPVYHEFRNSTLITIGEAVIAK